MCITVRRTLDSHGWFLSTLPQTSAEVVHAARDHQHLDEHEALGAESMSHKELASYKKTEIFDGKLLVR